MTHGYVSTQSFTKENLPYAVVQQALHVFDWQRLVPHGGFLQSTMDE